MFLLWLWLLLLLRHSHFLFYDSRRSLNNQLRNDKLVILKEWTRCDK